MLRVYIRGVYDFQRLCSESEVSAVTRAEETKNHALSFGKVGGMNDMRVFRRPESFTR